MKLQRWLGNCCAALLVLQVAVVLWGVITRYVFDNQAGWTEELARYLLIWVSLLGGAYATAQRKHIAIQLLPDRLTPPQRKLLYRLIDVLVLFFAMVVLVGGGSYYVYVSLSLGQRAPSLGIPVGYLYLVVPLSGVLVSLFLGKDIIHGRT